MTTVLLVEDQPMAFHMVKDTFGQETVTWARSTVEAVHHLRSGYRPPTPDAITPPDDAENPTHDRFPCRRGYVRLSST
jgi:hypothetical protein